MDNLIRDAAKIFTPHSSSVSAKNASRIWAFLSKFVMLDRFATTLGVREVHEGISVPKMSLSRADFAGASKVCLLLLKSSDFLNRLSAPR